MLSHPAVYFQDNQRVNFLGLQSFFPTLMINDSSPSRKILWHALETNSPWEAHSQLAEVSVGWLSGFPCHFSTCTASPPGRSSRSFSLSQTVTAPQLVWLSEEKKDFGINQQEGHPYDKHKRSQQISRGTVSFWKWKLSRRRVVEDWNTSILLSCMPACCICSETGRCWIRLPMYVVNVYVCICVRMKL